MGEFSRELLGGRQLLGKAHRRFRLVDCLDLAPHPAILMESSGSSPRSLDSMNLLAAQRSSTQLGSVHDGCMPFGHLALVEKCKRPSDVASREDPSHVDDSRAFDRLTPFTRTILRSMVRKPKR